MATGLNTGRLAARVIMLTAVAYVALMSGCKSAPKMGSYTIVVTLDEGLRERSGIMPSIEVDLIGVNEDGFNRLQGKNVDDYFSPGDVVRQDEIRSQTVHRMAFTNENPGAKRLAWGDPIWTRWRDQRNPSQLVIMSSMSLPPNAQTGAMDPRRLVIPLTTERWNDRQEINIVVRPSGLSLESPMKPERQR